MSRDSLRHYIRSYKIERQQISNLIIPIDSLFIFFIKDIPIQIPIKKFQSLTVFKILEFKYDRL